AGRGATRGAGIGTQYTAARSINGIAGNPINGEQGWAPGAIFQNPLTTIIGNFLWVNVGTFASSLWLNIDNNANLHLSLVVTGILSGYRLARGVSAVTGTATVVTGLATVVSVTATAQTDLDGDALAGVSATKGDQAGTPAAGSVILKAWKVTTGGAAGNPTLIAATAAANLNWIAVGT
ncbi:MAG TPA: hypothetical protein VNM37_07380, partial [Candidatus Dormibacteraeota bacterium]|nr:hypothetical protein [Candidatus Dormibacteraeota bacterium]